MCILFTNLSYSSIKTYEMLGMKDTPNTYADLSSGKGKIQL